MPFIIAVQVRIRPHKGLLCNILCAISIFYDHQCQGNDSFLAEPDNFTIGLGLPGTNLTHPGNKFQVCLIRLFL